MKKNFRFLILYVVLFVLTLSCNEPISVNDTHNKLDTILDKFNNLDQEKIATDTVIIEKTDTVLVERQDIINSIEDNKIDSLFGKIDLLDNIPGVKDLLIGKDFYQTKDFNNFSNEVIVPPGVDGVLHKPGIEYVHYKGANSFYDSIYNNYPIIGLEVQFSEFSDFNNEIRTVSVTTNFNNELTKYLFSRFGKPQKIKFEEEYTWESKNHKLFLRVNKNNNVMELTFTHK